MRGGRSHAPVQERRRQTKANTRDCRLLVFNWIVVGRKSAERALRTLSTELDEQERNQHSG